MVVVVLGGGVALLGGGGIALWAYLNPDTVASITGNETPGKDTPGKGGSEAVEMPDAPELVPDSKANERDLHVVRKSLEKLKGVVRKACKAEGDDKVELILAVDGTGKVLAVQGDGPHGTCAAKALTGKTLDRAEKRTVRVSYSYVW